MEGHERRGLEKEITIEEVRMIEDRIALLIDADNVSAKYIKPIMDELSKYGNITYKRIYGDWTNPALISWKSAL